ncbi:MAG TPA: hypothetical protein DEH78_07540 [Solibacterales bacterium]|nr:hypothetical protein [Bryobacterales bacterium]
MKLRSALMLFLFFLLTALALVAQQDRGSFTGTVLDPSGSAVPNVKVTITNTNTNQTSEVTTNEAGQYRVPNLPIGLYKIAFAANGFKSVVRDGLRLSVTDVLRIDAMLEVGATSESVTVTGEVPILQTETPEVGTLMTTRQVIDLPLGFGGGRYAENFAYKLTPGVSGNNWTSRINGAPAFSKEVVLDGASATIYIGGHLGESSPSMEAIEEFKVQTSGMSAEFARTAGGVFNFVLKSGTNQYHGSAMGQIHNEWMDANSFANNYFGRPKRLDRRHNYAFSGGGPVGIPKLWTGKDKWFFYSAYERYKEAYGGGGSPTVTLPVPEWYDGNMSRYLTTQRIGADALGRDVIRGAIYDPSTTRTVNGRMVKDVFANNMIPVSRISPISRRLADIMKKHYLPSIKDADGQFALLNNAFFPVSNQAGFTQDQFSVKSDYILTSNQRLNGSFVFVDRPRNLLDQGGVWDFNDPFGGPLSRARLQHVASHYIRMAHSWTMSPSLLNNLQLGFNRQLNPSTSRHVGEPGGQILGINGIAQGSNYPEITGLGGDRIGFPTLGYQANDVLAGTAYQLTNTMSWIRGTHSFKFGFDYRFNGLNARNNAGPGQFNFGAAVTGLPDFNQTGHGFASMLLGEVTSASVPTDTPVGSQFQMYAFFFQDDWKITPKLTLNLGLRWDYQPQGTEKYDRLSNFNPSLIDPLYNVPGAIEFAGQGQGRNGRRTFYPNRKDNFSPRIGLAWQPTAKTGVRAGYGIFYSGRVPNGWSGVPWGWKEGYKVVNTVNAPSTPGLSAFNWANGYRGVVTPGRLDPSMGTYLWGPVAWDPDGGRVGYSQQWNINIQREVMGAMVLDIGYVGTKSTGLPANDLAFLTQMPVGALALGDMLGQGITSQSQIPAAAAALGARYPFGNTGQWMTIGQALQPFPQIPNWSRLYAWNAPLGFSTYHALQVQFNKRYSNGIQWMANWTWSKAIDNINNAFGDTWGSNPQPTDYNNLRLEKAVSDIYQPHFVKVGVTWDMPFGRGRKLGSSMNRFMDFVVGGWTLQFIGNYQSGQPLGFGATGNPNFNSPNRAMIMNPNGDPLTVNFDRSKFDMSAISRPGTTGHKYINTALVVDPVTLGNNRYLRGNAARRYAQLRDFARYSDDGSLQKNFRPVEGLRVQFRAEFLNMFNRHRFSSINTSTNSPLYGQITGVSDDRRQIQFGIRADF